MTEKIGLPFRHGMLVEEIVLIRINDLLSFDGNEGVFNITNRIPDNTVLDKTLCTFTFPDHDLSSSVKKEDKFTFTLTELDGKRRYCHCKREVYQRSYCFCIISSYPSFTLFSNILDFLSQNINSKYLNDIFLDLFNKQFPKPNQTITNDISNSNKFTYTIKRIEDSLFEPNFITPSLFLNMFGASLFVDMLSHLLLERKFIFISESLQLLSSSVHTFSRLIYPFIWQHVLIPILPPDMLSLAFAPMPFIIGCTYSTFLQMVEEVEINDVYVFNLDTSTFLSFPSHPLLLTSDRSVQLRSQLNKLQKSMENDKKSVLLQSSDPVISSLLLDFYRYSFGFYASTYHEKVNQKTLQKVKGFDLTNPKTNPDKTGRTFFLEFLNSQMADMYFSEREKQVIEGKNIRKLCPLLIPYSSNPIFDTPSSYGYYNTKCVNCHSTILSQSPCCMLGSLPCHCCCYRCLSCFRIMLGDIKGDVNRMICTLCIESNSQPKHRTAEEYQQLLSKKYRTALGNISQILSQKSKSSKNVALTPTSNSQHATPSITPRYDSNDAKSIELFDFSNAKSYSTQPTIAFDLVGTSTNQLESEDLPTKEKKTEELNNISDQPKDKSTNNELFDFEQHLSTPPPTPICSLSKSPLNESGSGTFTFDSINTSKSQQQIKYQSTNVPLFDFTLL
ncbi:DENN domain-containing protein 2D, putative [Entamoeba dispar SAW760]|uniref:DENN domain-containing protein 2D, putative n=1 Tax=Entamoeba dispar (strain ATCC PRA-260 / SAW760) TaxID=370354 RepID=B0EK92_ENTDS|nr:DENN domain-containing protein 2D, putative [Entamoeba dispar SAW760]EDR25056.1 DENN domain-containing protein 2D, putative [Entamoeba dispar SAW760]|eukprot:EDR25056.1 DENN domain-containing protein 2D, putative [Entamoeba dispar SAW760]